MSFIATPEKNLETWDFITGDFYNGMSIVSDRYSYLYKLNLESPIKITLRDPLTNGWTKHEEFPGKLLRIYHDEYCKYSYEYTNAIDVHRSMLPNEIVIESDYPTYKENQEAARVIGKILEDKGFIPLYYYSGNKSVHIHVFFNWDAFYLVNEEKMDFLKKIFNGSRKRFRKKFILWLREKMISCWGTNAKKFDTDLIRSTHLIRAELSKNKIGYKTFIGYNYKDLSMIPYLCNEENRIYPKLGKVINSYALDMNNLMSEFINYLEEKRKKRRKKYDNNNSLLSNWTGETKKGLRPEVKVILSDDFKKVGDGFKRGMFILVNELKQVYGPQQAEVIAKDWNSRMGSPLKNSEIEYRTKMKSYSLTTDYVKRFLKDIGLNRNLFKK